MVYRRIEETLYLGALMLVFYSQMIQKCGDGGWVSKQMLEYWKLANFNEVYVTVLVVVFRLLYKF